MNGKAEGQGKWEERRQNKHSCCQYWEGRKVDAACATQKKSSSSASSVSLSGPFSLPAEGRHRVPRRSLLPAPTLPLQSSSTTGIRYAQGLLTTHRSDLTLQHLGTFTHQAVQSLSSTPHHPPPTHPSSLAFSTTQISSVLFPNIYQLDDLKLFDLSDGITYSSRSILNSQINRQKKKKTTYNT